MLDWLFAWLLPSPGGTGLGGFVLFALTLLVIVLHLVLTGKARKHRLESERWSMRAEQYAERAEAAERRAGEHAARAESALRSVRQEGAV